MKNRWSRIVISIAVIAGGLVVPVGSGAALGENNDRAVARQLDRLRTVTGAFHNEDLAVAGGYEKSDECVSTGRAGMGYHYVDPRILDAVVERDRPEALLYAPRRAGTPKLVGVEYIKVDEDQDLATDTDRPSLFGTPFDGPMPGHSPEMPVHYDLHVWLWRANPDGMFAPFNPRVRCS